jgi:hypothetical protein
VRVQDAGGILNGGIDQFSRTFRVTVTEPAALRLSMVKLPSGALQISWPTNAVGFTLVRKSGLDPAAPWSLVPATPALVGYRYVVTQSPVGNSAVYQLAKALEAGLGPLQIQPVGTGEIEISWPATFTGYVLEASSNILSQGWSPVSASPQTDGFRFIVRESMGPRAKYYRLRK